MAARNSNLVGQLEAADFVLVLLESDLLFGVEFREFEDVDFPQGIQVGQRLAVVGGLEHSHVVDEPSAVLKGGQELPVYAVRVQ